MSTKTRQRLCSFVYEGMRDRMERFIVLPFGIGCTSQSSIAIGPSDDHHQQKRSAVNNNVGPRKNGDRRAEGAKTKNMTFHFFSLRRSARISSGMQRLIRRSIKGFSQIFVYKEEDEDEMEEKEMEIGLPTDVKHVTHIGLDGSTTTNIAHPSSINQNGSSWESFKAPADLLSNFPSISLKQFELAMDAQTTHNQIPNILRS